MFRELIEFVRHWPAHTTAIVVAVLILIASSLVVSDVNKRSIQAQLVAVESRASVLQKRNADADARVTSAEAKSAALESKVATLTKNLDDAKREQEMLIAMRRSGEARQRAAEEALPAQSPAPLPPPVTSSSSVPAPTGSLAVHDNSNTEIYGDLKVYLTSTLLTLGDGGTSTNLDLAVWAGFQQSSGFEIDALSLRFENFELGTSLVSGARLPTAIASVRVPANNATKRVKQDLCLVATAAEDKEFEMWRNLKVFDCDNKLQENLKQWKKDTGFQPQV